VKVAGVVLAGGQSERMGQNKSLLKIHNKSLLQHASDILTQSGIKNVYISGKSGIQDKYLDKGPIGGILSCLFSLKEYTHVLFIPVDMPLLRKQVIHELLKTNNKSVAHFAKHNLPLIIKNNESTRQILENQIKNNNLSVYQLIEKFDTEVLEMSHKQEVFMNTNTPEQWRLTIHKLLKQQP